MNRREMESEGKPSPKGYGGGGECNHHLRGVEGGRRRSEPPSYGEELSLVSFQIIRKKTAAPSKEGRGRKHHPKEDGGRQHHQEEAGIAAIGGRHQSPRGGFEGEVHHSFLVVLPSFSSFGLVGKSGREGRRRGYAALFHRFDPRARQQNFAQNCF